MPLLGLFEMRIAVSEFFNAERLEALLGSMSEDPSVQSIFVAGASPEFGETDDIARVLQKAGKPVFGGLFPAIIHGGRAHRQGFVAVGFPHQAIVRTVQGLSRPETEVRQRLFTVLEELDARGGTLFVLVDGLAEHIGTLIDGIYDHYGLELHYLGGGCGGIDLKPRPCVLSDQGVGQDCAVLAWLPEQPSRIAVGHGWQPISEPFKVTDSSGGIIRSLDWRPAFQVYQEFVESRGKVRVGHDNFAEVARSYPLGIAKLDSEMVVRDPFLVDQSGAIRCFGDVPKGSHVHILQGSEEGLLKAAEEVAAAVESTARSGGRDIRLVFDCVSRSLYLGDVFEKELERLSAGSQATVGALTIGEIANYGDDYLEFYNKTAVVGVLEG